MPAKVRNCSTGLAVDPADNVFSYTERVDMSYYDAAIGKPAGQ